MYDIQLCSMTNCDKKKIEDENGFAPVCDHCPLNKKINRQQDKEDKQYEYIPKTNNP